MNPELWHTHPLLAFASLLPVLIGAAWMAVARELPGLRERRAPVTAFTWIVTRVVFAAVLWGGLHYVGDDTRTFFVPQARAVLAGGLPYRDVSTAYGPLFAPLLAPAVALLGVLGPSCLFLLADFGTWRALAASEGEASDAAWAWAAMPVVWISTVRYAQDEPLAALFVALAWAALRRRRPALSGLALGLGYLVTKPLFALPALALVAGANGTRDRGRMLLAATAPVALVLGGLLALRAPILQPFTREGAAFGVGPTLWRVPVVLTGFDPGAWGWLPFAVLALAGLVLLARRGANGATQAAWQFGAFAACSPKFLPMYALLWAPLLGTWAEANPDRRGWLVLEGTLLPLAWVLESGPLQGLMGPGWRALAVLGIGGTGLLALWPVGALVRAPRAARAPRG